MTMITRPYRITRLVNDVQVREIVNAGSPMSALIAQKNQEGELLSIVNIQTKEAWSRNDSLIAEVDNRRK